MSGVILVDFIGELDFYPTYLNYRNSVTYSRQQTAVKIKYVSYSTLTPIVTTLTLFCPKG